MPGPPAGECIGHDVYIRFVSYRGEARAGLIENHPRPDGRGRCEGYVSFDVPVNAEHKRKGLPVWVVSDWEPLTLVPSILCKDCGHHGFIREGQWVPA